jgi:hypothetical protein
VLERHAVGILSLILSEVKFLQKQDGLIVFLLNGYVYITDVKVDI